MIKQLARLDEMQQETFARCMEEINHVARLGGLMEFTTYSRLWEYPWLWFGLEQYCALNLRVLDVGSERSAFPWFLATRGFDVTVSDATAAWWQLWNKASHSLRVNPRRFVLDAQNLFVPTGSVDIYQSVSVIEHVPDKGKAIAEAARVLRPGGLMAITFDICEPDLGMTFPEWNGRALSMREFDGLFRDSTWFEPGLADISWNVQDIPAYLAWNRTTAPHHNYVTGAALIRRNDRVWQEPRWRDYTRGMRAVRHTGFSVAYWNLRAFVRAVKRIAHGQSASANS